MCVSRFRKMWNRQLGAQKCAAGVDLIHQIIALHFCFYSARQADGAGVINKNIESAKVCHCLIDCSFHLLFVSHVTFERQRFAASSLNFSGR